MNNSKLAIFAKDQDTIKNVISALIIAGYHFSYSYDNLSVAYRVDLESDDLIAAKEIADENLATYTEL